LHWPVTKAVRAGGLTAVSDGSGVKLGFDRDQVTTYLKTLAPDLATDPKNAAFEMKDGKVAVFEPSTDGEALDVEKAYDALAAAVFGETAVDSIDLTLKIVRPEITTESSNPLGIKEIIGIGESNFKGSPTNRRINIGIGAKSLDGLMVMPGEEFSLLNALGPIDGEHGYLQELVIKENKTTPEFGGGLCQIGSTTFRAALNAGMPITERRNHSYRVPYYERDGAGNYIGPGKDATIYDPAPDFKFLNDTGNAIMIKTGIKKNTLTFTFWGTRDGREAAESAVKVWNITPPPEKKIIETADLAPGATKCTEKPHEGADAIFTYAVTYANGEVKTRDFFSRYRPWGEVCLTGIDPAKAPANDVAPAALPSADAQGVTGR
ncbi:MAG: VanW family protein, partial [Patescibacteria group bacterium]